MLGEPQMLIKTLSSGASHWWIEHKSRVCDKLRTLKRVLNVHYTPTMYTKIVQFYIQSCILVSRGLNILSILLSFHVLADHIC